MHVVREGQARYGVLMLRIVGRIRGDVDGDQLDGEDQPQVLEEAEAVGLQSEFGAEEVCPVVQKLECKKVR